MAGNEDRHTTAKRKLDEQIHLREKQNRRQRLILIGSLVLVILLVVVAASVTFMMRHSDHSSSSHAAISVNENVPDQDSQLPSFIRPADLGQNCQYHLTSRDAARKVDLPRSGKVPTDPKEISASMMTNQGPIGLMLNNGQSPCTVNSFASLANKKFFDDTPCHRLTHSPSLSVLQCGDPTGTGTGGPGYEFGNEYPTNQYHAGDPHLDQLVTYPRGTIAMAHSMGRHDNGSQFFLVYQDSQLPPDYTIFGRIQEDGLATLDKIAAAGIVNGTDDGSPASPVTVESIRID